MKTLIDLERQFWTGDADFYRENLTSDAFMAFPGQGVFDREAIIGGIEGGQRWSSVEFSDERVKELPGGSAVLSYQALASREGADPYRAVVSSVYAWENNSWKLAFHHQSPVENSPTE